jgi:hypothetical protein
MAIYYNIGMLLTVRPLRKRAACGKGSGDKGNHNLLRPKAPKIERQLPMMLDRQEIESAGPDQIKDDVIIDDEPSDGKIIGERRV